MSAVFRVGLGKHHELYIRRIACQPRKALHQVVYFVGRQCEAKVNVRRLEGRYAVGQNVDYPKGCRYGITK